jgi:putative Ca2+/H+ antiporter (TMEM165/GDT1 family)
MNPTSLVFNYFFSIGAGAAAGIACVTIPALFIYRWIHNKIENRNVREME